MKRMVFLICILSACLLLPLACGGEDGTQAYSGTETVETLTQSPTQAPTPTPEPVRFLHVQEPTDAQTLMNRIMESDMLEEVEIDPGMMRNADIAAVMRMFPGVTFRYQVGLGGEFLPPDVKTLSTGTVPLEEIVDALPCLTALETVELGARTPEELDRIAAQLPGIGLSYRVRIYGREVDRDAETLDLSDLETLAPDELAAALPYLDALRTVSLGTRDDAEAAEAFKTAVPSVECSYVLQFVCLGRTLTSDMETLDLSQTKITDPDELKRAIEKLPKLTRVEMIDCGLDDETMAGLCDAFSNVRFIWEIDLGYWGKLRTDATAFSTRYQRSEAADKHRMTSEQVQYIRYCTDLIALDLGHQKLTDITFLRPLKKLRVLILADNYISEIGVLAELSELEYIELFMNRITDLSPLENLAYLHDLNVCSNKISDFKPVCAIKTLERFWYAKNNATSKDHKMLQEALPDCVLNHTDTGTDGGWRFSDKNKKERSEREKWKNAFFEGAPRYT